MRAYARCSECHRQMSVDLDDLNCDCGGSFKVVHPNTVDHPLLPAGSQPRLIHYVEAVREVAWSEGAIQREVDRCMKQIEARLQAEVEMDAIDRRQHG